MSMPRRPRSHAVGDQAVDKFKSLFRGWIVRETPNADYGVDAEVEVVDDTDQVTGISFKAQVKGTNPQSGRPSKSVRVKVSTLNYWRSQDVPVLVFYCLTESGVCYARWAHSYDPVAERRRRNREASGDLDHVTFYFSEDDRIYAESKIRLLEELIAIRALGARDESKPIPVRISVDDSGASPLDEDDREELHGRLTEVLDATAGALKPSGPDDGAPADLRISRQNFRFSMPAELSSLTFHFDDEYPGRVPDGDFHVMSADAMVSAAVTLAGMGLTRKAISLYEQYRDGSSVANKELAWVGLSNAYLDEGRPDDALTLITPALSSREIDERLLGRALLAPILSAGARLKDESRDTIVALARRGIDLELQDSNPHGAADYCYLAANLRRSEHQFIEALDLYQRLPQLDSRYLERGYFYRESGGCYADLGRWHEAADTYGRGKQCPDPEHDSDFVFADALLQSGRFSEAERIASGPTQDADHGRSRLLILKEVASFAAGRLNLSFQYRSQLAEEALNALPLNGGIAGGLDALASTDALDANLLSRTFQLLDEEDDEEIAFSLIITLAWVNLVNTVSWLFSLHLAIDTNRSDELQNAIADAMFYFCRDEVTEAVEGLRQEMPADEFVRLRRVVSRRRAFRYEIPFLVRVFDSEGNVEVFNLD